MKIPNKTLKKWQDLKQEGDIALLAKEIGKSEPVVYAIFKTGEASKVEYVEKINEFYKKRSRQVKKAVSIDED